MQQWLAPLSGLILVLAALVDVFLTVLYARSGVGLVSHRLNKSVWRLARHVVAPLPERRASTLLTFVGPSLLVLTALMWSILLTAGFALIVWPGLGTGVQASQGSTPTDFWTAFYYSGFNLTTLGVGDLVPKSPFDRTLAVLEAGLGFFFFTLTLTYFMSVYGALIRRSTLALQLDHMSGCTGDAAELLARLGASGDFGAARTETMLIAQEVLFLREAHHSYPVLHYFRRREPAFATARVALVVLDAASLARTVLDGGRHRSFTRSAALEALWGSGMRLLTGTRDFVPRSPDMRDHGSGPPDGGTDEHRWRRRFAEAARRLHAEGIATTGTSEADANEYVALRMLWDGEVRGLAAFMAHSWTEIAPHEAPQGSEEPAATDRPPVSVERQTNRSLRAAIAKQSPQDAGKGE